MSHPFQRNFGRYRVRGEPPAAAKVINHYMANSFSVPRDGGIVEYNWDALDPLRALGEKDAIAVLLLAYEHFLRLIDLPAAKTDSHGDNFFYAAGLDFAIQMLARNRRLPFSTEQLARLIKAYLKHPGPAPCLPPHIIVGVIATVAGKLARAGALGPGTKRPLEKVAAILHDWDREECGTMPPALLRRIEKALQLAAAAKPATRM